MDEPHSLGFLMGRTCLEQRKLAGQLLETSGIGSGQPPLLFALMKRDGLTNAELAQKLEVSPATITNMVKRMESAGFVSRQRNPADDRAIRVCLTDKGQEVCAEIKRTMGKMEALAYKSFSDEDKYHLRSLLLRVLDNVREAQGEDRTLSHECH